MKNDLPSTARMIVDTKKLSRDLRVKELRGLAKGIREKGAPQLQGLAKLLSEVAEEIEEDSSELYRVRVAALEAVESAKGAAP